MEYWVMFVIFVDVGSWCFEWVFILMKFWWMVDWWLILLFFWGLDSCGIGDDNYFVKYLVYCILV